MSYNKPSTRSATARVFLFGAVVTLALVLVLCLPPVAGRAQHQPLGTISGAASPTGSSTSTATPTVPVQTTTQTPTTTPQATAECQAEWKVVPAPGLRTFKDLAAISSEDVWVVGDDGAIHWNGADWFQVPTAGVMDLTRISAVASDDVWATNGFQVIRWDGTSWSLAYDPPRPETTASYSDLVAIAADDVWVVGSHWGNPQRPATYATHWDGEEWTVVESPGPGTQGTQMLSVSGIPGGHVWATSYWPVELLYWTGENWGSTSPDGGDGWPWRLSAIEVLAPDDIWAGGYFSNGSTNLQHYDGSQWHYVASPDIGNITAISATAQDDVWAVGQFGTLHWDGSAWSLVPAPDGPIVAVDAVGPVNAWAVQELTVLHYSEDPFWDVSPSNPFYSYVRCLACRGMVSGYSDGFFRTNEHVTRGQVAKIISNAAGYNDEIPSDRQTFEDVPPDSPFWVYIERVYAREAIGGYPCGAEGEPCPGIYYRPGAYLTRGQLAKIATIVAGYEDTSESQTFNDVPPGSPFYIFIERAAAHNVISGYPCGGGNPDTGEGEPCPGAYFRPASNVTRGQTAKIVVNSLLPACGLPARR